MATKKTESGCRVAPAEANLPFPGSALHGSLTLAGHTWTLETLSLRHFSANIKFFAKMLINPNSNHSFELLITEFPPCGCILHVLLNCFALVNLSFLSFFQCNQGPSQRISEGRGKKMFSPLQSFFIHYLEFFCKEDLSLLPHLFSQLFIYITGRDFHPSAQSCLLG